MPQQDFTALIAAEGFAAERVPFGSLNENTHPSAVKTLVVSGEITIKNSGGKRIYRSGDVFMLVKGEPHSETFGSDNVRCLKGRSETR